MNARAGSPIKRQSAVTAALGEAVRHHQAGRRAAAAAGYRRVLAINPQHPDALHLLGLLSHQQGDQTEAARLVTAALAAAPRIAAFHNTLAAILLAQSEPAAAIDAARRAAALDPTLLSAWNTLGNAQVRAGDAEAAVASYRQALALAPANVEALNNLGSALHALGHLTEAETALTQALAARPAYAAAAANLALVLRDQGRFAAALATAERALAHHPDNPTWRTNRAVLLLQLGRFTEGWAEYEWRWQADGFVRVATSATPLPRWDGSDSAGRSILLRGEQGLGSMIQFARYAPLLARRGARIILQCPEPLQRLFATSFLPPNGPLTAVITALGETGARIDTEAPLMSLPHLCGTSLSTIPADVPYLRADPPAVAAWADRLNEQLPDDGRRRIGLGRIGLVWAGNPAHANDRNRSMPAVALVRLLTGAKGQFVSLQVGPPPPPALLAAGLVDLTPALTDFAATAAAIANLDLVISVDTAVAHLAGALAKPVWLLLPHAAEWRWLFDRSDSPWYPTMRLFRQSRPGDWDELVGRVATALTEDRPT